MRRLLPLALALALPGLAGAQDIDLSKGGPIDVTARDGIEWRQADQVIIARGEAQAIRGNVTVNSDRLIARYRSVAPREVAPAPGAPPRPAATPAAAPASPASPAPGASPNAGPPRGGANEIWRLEAEGKVTIKTDTDTARGDRAVYDVDNAVMVLTGRDLSLKTRQQDISASDSLEYWSQKKMAVARGNAKVIEPAENRQITGDTLVAYFLDTPRGQPAPARPGERPGERQVPGQGRMDRVEAFGNVEIRTPTDVVRGDRGVYSAETGMARLLGGVRITRGDNQVNGQEAIVNMRTGIARLVSTPGARVQGLIVPREEQQAQPEGGATPTPAPARRQAPQQQREPRR